MKAALAFAFYCVFLVSARRRAPPSSQETATEAATEAATTVAVDSSSDDAVQTLVKAYIDAGTCGQITTGDSCGDSTESYYSEFEYNGRRVVIANGIPNHDAEHDQYFVNPNTRCERWTFMSLPLSPSQGSSPVSTDMGVTGLATTGGTFYNHLSSPRGDVAMYNEGTSLDSCTGHSSSDGQYHYHANILCDEEASDPDTCKMIGYMRDGIPIYGYCKDASGVQFSSCFSLVSGATESEVNMAAGIFMSASLASSYEYSASGDCNLDEANGAVHPVTGEYSYFMTETYPWLPIYYYGSEGSVSLCDAA